MAPIIPILTAASGLDIRLRNTEGLLTDPTTITYDIEEPAGSLVADDAVPFKRSVGIYDARTTIIPSGFSTATPWKITWVWTSPGGVTSTKCEDFNVSGALTGFFDDITDIRTQIRLDLNVGTTELTDAELNVIVQKSVDRINFKLQLQGTSEELTFDTNTGQICPAPNGTIRAFVVMQSECLIVKRRMGDAVSKGIRVRDGESEIDTTAGFKGHKDIISTVCGQLDACIAQYLKDKALGVFGETGAAQHGDLIWAGNSRIFEDADFDGDAFTTKDFRSPFDAEHLGHFGNHRCSH